MAGVAAAWRAARARPVTLDDDADARFARILEQVDREVERRLAAGPEQPDPTVEDASDDGAPADEPDPWAGTDEPAPPSVAYVHGMAARPRAAAVHGRRRPPAARVRPSVSRNPNAALDRPDRWVPVDLDDAPPVIAAPRARRPQVARARRPLVAREMAKDLLSRGQVVTLAASAAVLGLCFAISWDTALRAIVVLILLFWGGMVALKLRLAVAAHATRRVEACADVDDPTLPGMTVLVPLYHEANMVRGLRDALGRLRYPAERVQILLLLEEHDGETIAAAREHEVPYLVVPPGGPKNKPNALNFGLAEATGELTVVYDAEDRPEPDELLKFVARFRESGPDVACVQARLMFWNASSSWVSRFYWVEYVIHFDWVLAGLVALRLVPPLGGTSNCFKTAVLKEVAFRPEVMPFQGDYIGGWDPWNVTEDADLAGGLALRGYRVVMTDAVTYEEAPARVSVALGQRSRWLKGYLHTGLVYTRHPLRMARTMGVHRYVVYIVLMLGTPVSILLTPLFWLLTIVYFATRSTYIEHLFPAPVFYFGLALMLAGNLALFYQKVIACLHRDANGGVKYMLLSPLWDLFGFAVLARVVYELCRKDLRHRWVKTDHGHDSDKEDELLSLELG